ncbi:MAG: hypothetical protein ACR2RA_00270, partial [Geminicoccaceae bacterium]
MTGLATSPTISSSRRRFVTFGGALILAACLTLVKMTLVALDVNERDFLGWPAAPGPQAAAEAPAMPGATHAGSASTGMVDDSKFVPWPTFVPEPAAGPAGQD